MRIDIHSHLIFLDYLQHLAGRRELPRGMLEGGTDHPFAHFNAYNVMVDNLAYSEAERERINRGNAERLLGLSKKEADDETK